MQTFLPYPSILDSANCLDRQRLGKQRVECKQIYTALTNPSYGWQNHPAVNMWREHEDALAVYGYTICTTWVKRGYKDTLLPWFQERLSDKTPATPPPWFGSAAFHDSHKSNLLRKDPVWYGQFGWTVPADLPYVWPTSNTFIAA